MDKITKQRIESCAGNDGCAPDLNDGKAIVDKVRLVRVREGLLKVPFEIDCSCGNKFKMVHFEEKCPSCNMVYGVTPCSSHDIKNIKAAGINY